MGTPQKAKDFDEEKPNYSTTLMKERNIPVNCKITLIENDQKVANIFEKSTFKEEIILKSQRNEEQIAFTEEGKSCDFSVGDISESHNKPKHEREDENNKVKNRSKSALETAKNNRETDKIEEKLLRLQVKSILSRKWTLPVDILSTLLFYFLILLSGLEIHYRIFQQSFTNKYIITRTA